MTRPTPRGRNSHLLEKTNRLEKWIRRHVEGQRPESSEWVQSAKWSRFDKEPNGRVGEVDCYILSAEFNGGKARLWIGEEDFLVHQSQERIQSKVSETTDADVSRLLNDLQLPLPLNEMKRRINEGQKKAEATSKPVTVIFTTNASTHIGKPTLTSMTVQPPSSRVYTQTHEAIIANELLSATNFTHQKALPGPGKN